MAYDEKKFAELVLYIAAKCQHHEHFGATKLNKILFFSDFTAYYATRQAITGAVYQKLPYGPAPKRLVPVQQQLIKQKAAAIQTLEAGPYTEKRLVALRPARLDLFTAAEISRVDAVIEALRDGTATRVSDMSHKLQGWQLAKLKEDIPYFTVNLRGGRHGRVELSAKDEEWARTTAAAFVARKSEAGVQLRA